MISTHLSRAGWHRSQQMCYYLKYEHLLQQHLHAGVGPHGAAQSTAPAAALRRAGWPTCGHRRRGKQRPAGRSREKTVTSARAVTKTHHHRYRRGTGAENPAPQPAPPPLPPPHRQLSCCCPHPRCEGGRGSVSVRSPSRRATAAPTARDSQRRAHG